MPLKFIIVPIRQTELAENERNAFLSTHRVLNIDRRWVDVGFDSFWSVCIDYLETSLRHTHIAWS